VIALDSRLERRWCGAGREETRQEYEDAEPGVLVNRPKF